MSEDSVQQPNGSGSAEPGEQRAPSQNNAPRTGEPVVDEALDALTDLESAPLDERHERLARVHEDLHRALNAE